MSNAIRLEIVRVLREGPRRVTDTAQRSGQEMVYQIANPKIVSICDLMREVLAEDAARPHTPKSLQICVT